MSFITSVRRDLICDACCARVDAAPDESNPRSLRAVAKKMQWRYKQGKDYCPACAPAYVRTPHPVETP